MNRWNAFSMGLAVLAMGLAVIGPGRKAASPAPVDVPAEEKELAPYMGELQRHTHKLGLAIAAENAKLSEFYLAEIMEMLDEIVRDVPEHDGWPIADSIRTIMYPLTPALRSSLAGGDWAGGRAHYERLVDGCNRCHAATEHEFIRMRIPDHNPFNQDF
jgi:hypothetical protein